MKKIFSTICFLAIVGMTMAQDVKTYSVYDSNQSGDLNIADVSTVVDKVKANVAAAGTQQYVTADELNATLQSINSNLLEIKARLSAMEKQGVYVYPFANGHEYVDLGLPSGTLWATCNVGAENPEDAGLYFAWGETTGYTSDTSDGHSFDWASYKWCNGSYNTQTKYCTSSSYGSVDDKTELESADDAATANWGSNWCMPTHAQQQELVNSSYTSTEWTTVNGVYGRKITSLSNGNSLFLPAAGYRSGSGLYDAGSDGGYWSGELRSNFSDYAWGLYFDSSNVSTSRSSRCCGQPVRAVRSE